MRLLSLFLAALILGLVLLACNSRDATKLKGKIVGASGTPAKPAPQNDGVRRVTPVELRDALAKGEAIVWDVRNEATFKDGHIKGARLVPVNEVLSKAGELPHDKLIVTYCS
jgi:predicted sulfurtransferase